MREWRSCKVDMWMLASFWSAISERLSLVVSWLVGSGPSLPLQSTARDRSHTIHNSFNNEAIDGLHVFK
jgi:hypothetical protein